RRRRITAATEHYRLGEAFAGGEQRYHHLVAVGGLTVELDPTVEHEKTAGRRVTLLEKQFAARVAAHDAMAQCVGHRTGDGNAVDDRPVGGGHDGAPAGNVNEPAKHGRAASILRHVKEGERVISLV